MSSKRTDQASIQKVDVNTLALAIRLSQELLKVNAIGEKRYSNKMVLVYEQRARLGVNYTVRISTKRKTNLSD
jgi:hypothetical protein